MDDFLLTESTGCDLKIDWDGPSSRLLSLRGDQGGNSLKLSVRKAPRRLLYFDRDGRERDLPGLNGMHRSQVGQTIILETSWRSQRTLRGRKRLHTVRAWNHN